MQVHIAKRALSGMMNEGTNFRKNLINKLLSIVILRAIVILGLVIQIGVAYMKCA